MHDWLKRGRLSPGIPPGFSEARSPCATPLGGDRFAVAFTALDVNHRSHVFLCGAQAKAGHLELEPEATLALRPGKLGHFDEAGAMTSCFAEHEGKKYLYYTGWQLLREVSFTFGCGRAGFDPHTLSVCRELPGPVLARDHLNPLLCASPFVMKSSEGWVMWYVGGVRWERTDSDLAHYYTIRRAVSRDALRWESDPEPCIPLGPQEYAIARPSVLRLGNILHMWFCHRGFGGNLTYRIGYAYSEDGLHWERQTRDHALDVSTTGWDSEMVCYPHVFAHEGWLYMLYNGNGFGATGFGYASARLA